MQEIAQYDHASVDLRDTSEYLNSLETALSLKEKHVEQLGARRYVWFIVAYDMITPAMMLANLPICAY